MRFLDMTGRPTETDLVFESRLESCGVQILDDIALVWGPSNGGEGESRAYAAALDLRARRLLWTERLELAAGEVADCSHIDANRAVFTSNASSSVSAYRLATGELLWSYRSAPWKGATTSTAEFRERPAAVNKRRIGTATLVPVKSDPKGERFGFVRVSDGRAAFALESGQTIDSPHGQFWMTSASLNRLKADE